MAEAARHQERVHRGSAAWAAVVKGASLIGSNFASMKAVLVARGVIKTATCRAPFRAPTRRGGRAAPSRSLRRQSE